MGCVCPLWPCLGLTVVVEGIEKDRRLELSVKFGSGDSRGHPLMVREQSQEGLPTHVTIVPVSPVCVHELYGFPQDIFTLKETKRNVSMHAVIEYVDKGLILKSVTFLVKIL